MSRWHQDGDQYYKLFLPRPSKKKTQHKLASWVRAHQADGRIHSSPHSTLSCETYIINLGTMPQTRGLVINIFETTFPYRLSLCGLLVLSWQLGTQIKTRSNHYVSDLHVGKFTIWYLVVQTIFPTLSSSFFRVSRSLECSEVGDFRVVSCFVYQCRLYLLKPAL
jgi:hypothetical protein